MQSQAAPLARLICPPICPADPAPDRLSDSGVAIRAVAPRFTAPETTFGLELKVAYLMEAEGVTAPAERLRRPFYRLAQEPIIWSWWDALQRVPLDAQTMLNLASILNGGSVAYRHKEIYAAGEPGRPGLIYETPERATNWIADIAAADEAGGDPVKAAFYRYARIVFAHPFTDANGRIARAALQGGLARAGLIATPCLALAPVFHLHEESIREAIGGLSRSGDWSAYFVTMAAVLADGLGWIARTP
jgi:hypothetical protein